MLYPYLALYASGRACALQCSTAYKTADALAADSLRIGRLAAEAPECPSGDDPPMLAGEIGVSRDRTHRRKVEIALKG